MKFSIKDFFSKLHFLQCWRHKGALYTFDLVGVSTGMCGALRDLIPFVQFRKREKHPWRSVTLSKVASCNFTKSNTPSWVFFTFFKLYKWYQITQIITYMNYFLVHVGPLLKIQNKYSDWVYNFASIVSFCECFPQKNNEWTFLSKYIISEKMYSFTSSVLKITVGHRTLSDPT